MGRYSVKYSDNWQYHVLITCNTVITDDAVICIDCYKDMEDSDTRIFDLYTILPLTASPAHAQPAILHICGPFY